MEEEKKINWFPGHMKNALADIEENKIKLADLILYVLDGRAPISCQNPKLEKISHGKKILYVINKIDLADELKVKKIKQQFESEGKTVILISSKDSQAVGRIKSAIKSILSEKMARNSAKNANITYKLLVLGVPNTGKSTIINLLCESKKAKTGNIAGVTRTNVWLKAGEEFVVLDTPGVLWPKFDEQISYNLAIIGCINDVNLDKEDMGFKLIKFLFENYIENLKSRFDIDFGEINCIDNNKNDYFEDEFLNIYDKICRKRGFILRGNEIDYERAGKAFVDEFRAGKFGKITLD